ncbi:nicotinamide mononucleotide deamidase-related protein [Candidatus Bathyarchaeota archaeon]|nr:nicotinamide mononucleotide deamidase-related protein [Candidatus Bathyarchaeota archaeon]
MTEMEIICIGNELLIGKTANTNSQWLSKRAINLGVVVRRITVVSDKVEEIAEAILEALNRKGSFIITTGGLGPTFDDKTLEGLARALNRRLQINQKALRMVKEKYKKYAQEKQVDEYEMTQPRLKMATIPENAIPLRNPGGTAPGVLVDLEETTIVALPGVPSEMMAIFEEAIAPLLKEATDQNNFCEKSIYADQIMESTLAPLIDKVMRNNPHIYIKSHPKREENKPHIEIHFSTTTRSTEAPKKTIEKAVIQLSKLINESGGKVIANEYSDS